jgi:hypothetical protein
VYNAGRRTPPPKGLKEALRKGRAIQCRSVKKLTGLSAGGKRSKAVVAKNRKFALNQRRQVRAKGTASSTVDVAILAASTKKRRRKAPEHAFKCPKPVGAHTAQATSKRMRTQPEQHGKALQAPPRVLTTAAANHLRDLLDFVDLQSYCCSRLPVGFWSKARWPAL